MTGQDGAISGDGAPSGDGGAVSVPKFDHVFLIVMENESQVNIQGNTDAPYINQLIGMYAYTNKYSTTYHPSLPNYLDLTSGSTQGVTCDCQPTGTACDSTCALLTGACGCPQSVTNLGDQLDSVSVQWRDYAQSMGTPCNPTLAAPYAPKHVPFLYYDDVYTNMTRCQQRVRDYSDFAADLAAGTYRFAFIAPNLCDDMHGDTSCPSTPSEIAQGDTWLSHEVPKILATPGFGANGKDVLFIAWDEQTGSTLEAPRPRWCSSSSHRSAKKGATNTPYTRTSRCLRRSKTPSGSHGSARRPRPRPSATCGSEAAAPHRTDPVRGVAISGLLLGRIGSECANSSLVTRRQRPRRRQSPSPRRRPQMRLDIWRPNPDPSRFPRRSDRAPTSSETSRLAPHCATSRT